MPDDRELRVLANEPQSRHSLEQKMSEVVHQQATINDLISESASRRLRVSKGAPWMSKLLECTAIACMHTEAVAAAPSSVAPTGCKAHSAEFEHLECHVVRHDCGKPLAPTRRDRSRSLPIFDVASGPAKWSIMCQNSEISDAPCASADRVRLACRRSPRRRLLGISRSSQCASAGAEVRNLSTKSVSEQISP